MKLLYANRTPSDTLLLSELHELQRKHPQQLEVRFLVEQHAQNEQPDVESILAIIGHDPEETQWMSERSEQSRGAVNIREAGEPVAPARTRLTMREGYTHIGSE